MKTAIIIPARYASSRLPAKPLLRETGKYLIQHVYERACESRVDQVIVATDDWRIFQAVESFGGQVVMTRDDHVSGTDRVAEVAERLDADLIVNLQGDEPMIEPDTLDRLAQLLAGDCDSPMATLAVPIASQELYRDPNCVKVICDRQGRALYFSRSPIPFVRDGEPDFSSGRFLQHLGLYAYRRDFLLKLATLPPEPLEEIERLEQLRVLALGYRIQVGVVPHAHRGVDTPEDYRRFVELFQKRAA
ncbi:MAG: 3-deoxy-manno-octulosonate cytidylyltransferase [Planctomycetes bacterium]|jgi:3-deoxy-manno-octulosonate cytidylyltransferase (CMP-KDO synthetase)|nr:3-deoxy-manno-octulosonate cytidylyltransferase [Planctomycetota bacterium]